MPKKLEEITITYLSERMRFENDWGATIIGSATRTDTTPPQSIAIKGPADGDDPARHHAYRLYGSWQVYHNKRTGLTENQFVFQTLVTAEPHSRAGVIAYLARAPKIGRVLAVRLWDEFGGQAVRILREQPDVAAAAITKLSDEHAVEAAEWLERQQALEDCTIDLIELLDGRGFPKSLAKNVVKVWGNASAKVLKANPYLLMRFRGCGFKRCDAMYLDLGGDPAALKRQALCAWHAVASNTNGDTWHYAGVPEQGLRGAIGGAPVDADRALRLATRSGLLSRVWTDGREGPVSWDGNVAWLADTRKATSERRVAEYVAEASRDRYWGRHDFCGGWDYLTDHQSMALWNAMDNRIIGILGGSPGTGKTYTAARFIASLIHCYSLGADDIAVCAPTGKAAVRITEVMQSYGIKLRARTIHSLLGVEQAEDRGGWTFRHNRANPLPYKFIIVDESSMIDTDLMASFLAARGSGTTILFVGDVNQLLPVGHGSPLRDMILAGVPYGELTEIHRNEGGIVQACADMREGRDFQVGGNLHHHGATTPSSQVDDLLRLLDEYWHGGLDPVWECQILVAVNKRSPLARKALNERIRSHLNPNPNIPGSPFWLADKVINTKNGFYATVGTTPPDAEANVNERGEVYVANGEMGRVEKVEPKYLEVRLTSPERLIRVPRGTGPTEGEGSDGEESDDATGTGCNWDLAYAISTHKSQGSEWPVVIVMIDEYPGARQICDRAWLYTAVSRAKQACHLVGQLATAQRFARINNISRRKTFLAQLITDALARSPHYGDQKTLACHDEKETSPTACL